MSLDYTKGTDYFRIAEGIIDILESWAASGDDTYLNALAFGMMPNPLMEMVEKAFTDKIYEREAARFGVSVEQLKTHLQGTKQAEMKAAVDEFMRELSITILNVAARKDILLV